MQLLYVNEYVISIILYYGYECTNSRKLLTTSYTNLTDRYQIKNMYIFALTLTFETKCSAYQFLFIT